MKRPFRVPLSPVIPIVSALACLYLMTNLSAGDVAAVRHLDGAGPGRSTLIYGRRNARLAQSDYDRTASSSAR